MSEDRPEYAADRGPAGWQDFVVIGGQVSRGEKMLLVTLDLVDGLQLLLAIDENGSNGLWLPEAPVFAPIRWD